MRTLGRNILLLVDNASTHALYETTHLTNITIEYLPPNTTAHLQPCDQGIGAAVPEHPQRNALADV